VGVCDAIHCCAGTFGCCVKPVHHVHTSTELSCDGRELEVVSQKSTVLDVRTRSESKQGSQTTRARFSPEKTTKEIARVNSARNSEVGAAGAGFGTLCRRKGGELTPSAVRLALSPVCCVAKKVRSG
jgi:hypothetical protein